MPHETRVAKTFVFGDMRAFADKHPASQHYGGGGALLDSISDADRAVRIVAPKRRRKRPCADAKRSFGRSGSAAWRLARELELDE
jgi:hypothetical protein